MSFAADEIAQQEHHSPEATPPAEHTPKPAPTQQTATKQPEVSQPPFEHQESMPSMPHQLETLQPPSGMPEGYEIEPVEMETEEQLSPMQELIMTNMRRDGSARVGYRWINPMLMEMKQWKNWTGMLHWNVFANYDHQARPRGEQGFYSQNWIMASVASPVREKGVMQFRAMMPLEPLTVGGHGYPFLFQIGETFNDEPLIDRQHPHDLFMNYLPSILPVDR